jgi:hypothetical protein
MSEPMLKLDEFLRELKVNRDSPHMMFIGAGASVESGVKSASDCIQEWKEDLFNTRNGGPAKSRDELDGWLRQQIEYPPQGAPDEYGFYVQRCFPNPSARRKYFERICREAKPSIGYHMLALLARAEIIRAVWTTNFDHLACRAAQANGVDTVEAGLDFPVRARTPFRPCTLLHVSLHGDYRYDLLKNAPDEIRQPDEVLRGAMQRRVEEYPLIVVGYSGRDDSIMETLREAYAHRWSGGLYWCGLSDKPTERVRDVLNCVSTAKMSTNLSRWSVAEDVPAHYIPGITFDHLLTAIGIACLEGELLRTANSLVERDSTAVKPSSVISQYSGKSYASMQLAAMLIARASSLQKSVPDNIWGELSNLPGFRVDQGSFEMYGNDVIYRAWMTTDKGESEVWAGVGMARPSPLVALETKLLDAERVRKLRSVGDDGEGIGGSGQARSGRPHETENKVAEHIGGSLDVSSWQFNVSVGKSADELVPTRTSLETYAVFGETREQVIEKLSDMNRHSASLR